MVKKAPGNPGLFLCPAGTGPKSQQTLGSDSVRAFSAKLFTSATAVLPKSGTDILPVITGHHRQASCS